LKENQSLSFKMNVIKSLFIPCVSFDVDADYIIDAFYCSNIATLSRVTLLPFITKTGLYLQRVYIDIAYWFETEVAYNFIKRLHDNSIETRFIHNKHEEWWTVEINKKPYITHDKKLKGQTTINYLVEETKEPFNATVSEPDYNLFKEDPDWREIEIELSQMLAYQNLEYELCI